MKRKHGFRKMTPQQKRTYAALRALGEIFITPQDARPLRALWKRGLVRYRNTELGRVAVLRSQEVIEKRRLKKTHRYFGWPVSS